MSHRRRIYEILNYTKTDDKLSKVVNEAIFILILVNFICIAAGTTEWGKSKILFFDFIEAVSVYVFTIEFILRIWSCVEKPEYSKPILGRFRHAITPLLIIDFLSILPFFLQSLLPLNLIFLRILRLFRIFRIFKLVRYVETLRIFKNLIMNKKEQLIMTFFITSILMIISSCLMYYAENDAQPDKFSSIPATFWWAVCTLTTVGYGDVFPITSLGKILASVVSVLGIGVFALPAGILASGMMEEINKKPNIEIICPNCGHKIEK